MNGKITYTTVTNLKGYMLKNKKLQNAIKILVVLVLALLLFPLTNFVGDKIQEILPEEVVEVLQEEETTETTETEEVTEDSEAEPKAEEDTEESEEVEVVDYTSLDYRIPAMQDVYDDYEAAYPDGTYYQADELGRVVYVQSVLNDGNILTCYDYFQDEDPKYCEHTADGILGEDFDYIVKTIEPTEDQTIIMEQAEPTDINPANTNPITSAVTGMVETVKDAVTTETVAPVVETVEEPVVETAPEPKTVEVPATETTPAQVVVEETVEVNPIATELSNKLISLGYDITVAPGEITSPGGIITAGVKNGDTMTCWEGYCLLNEAPEAGQYMSVRTPYLYEEFFAL